MQITIPHPRKDSVGSVLAALEILYYGSLSAALAAAKKRNAPAPGAAK